MGPPGRAICCSVAFARVRSVQVIPGAASGPMLGEVTGMPECFQMIFDGVAIAGKTPAMAANSAFAFESSPEFVAARDSMCPAFS